MATIQWRPEVNALTTPPSYRILFVPRMFYCSLMPAIKPRSSDSRQ